MREKTELLGFYSAAHILYTLEKTPIVESQNSQIPYALSSDTLSG
jgi:hypothetical protein